MLQNQLKRLCRAIMQLKEIKPRANVLSFPPVAFACNTRTLHGASMWHMHKISLIFFRVGVVGGWWVVVLVYLNL